MDSGFAAIGFLKTLLPKSENDSVQGSLFQRQRSCIGPLSRAQVVSYTAHKRAFLLWPGRNAPQRGEGFCWKRRRQTYLMPPLWEGGSLPKATTPRGKRLTAFSVAYGSLRMQFAAHWSGQRSGARPTTLSPIHPSGPFPNHQSQQLDKLKYFYFFHLHLFSNSYH